MCGVIQISILIEITFDQLHDSFLPLLQPRAEGEEHVKHLQDAGLPLRDDTFKE